MVNIRVILAGLIAVAVAVAPVGAALAAGHASGKQVTHDCHGKAPQDINKMACPDCDSQTKAKCPGDGSKCCKLTGALAVLPALIVTVAAVDRASDPEEPLGWQLRPRPPPPRS